jgi:hypothetical protein
MERKKADIRVRRQHLQDHAHMPVSSREQGKPLDNDNRRGSPSSVIFYEDIVYIKAIRGDKHLHILIFVKHAKIL